MKSARTKKPRGTWKLAAAAFLAAALAQPVAHAQAETYTKSFTYDLNGNIATRTTPDNGTVSYTYDGVNRLTDITYPDGKNVSFTYDGNGNRLSMTDPTGTTGYAYDRFNRLTAVQPPGILPMYYDYDNSGNLTRLTYPDGTAVTYEYDSSNRLWKATDPNGTTTYDYDNTSNNLSRKTLPNGVYTTYTYDTAKRITDIINRKSDNSVISSHHYVFDANGNRTQAVETTAAGTKTTNYTYDKLNRLTNATCSDGAYETYTYDSSGNRLTKTTQNGVTTYDYDQDNRLIKIGTATGNTALFYDRSGNLTRKISATKTINYGYDYENRLTSYSDGATTVTFAYDGDGNRVSKNVNGAITKFINDTSSPISQVLLETNSQHNVTARYTYGDSRLSQMNGGVTSYYVYDNPGRSVVAVVSGAQAVVNSYAFNAFGDIKAINETTANDYLYVGERYDDETVLIYLRKRYYDPETGRFLSKDPFPGYVTQPQTINPFPYVENNPINKIDPSGLASPQNVPPNVNIRQNVEEAKNMSPIEFYNAVKTGGKWDYKNIYGGKYEDFGNYHFGVVGKANNWSTNTLLSGAGAYQIYSDLLTYGTKTNPGWPFISSPYGDQTQDQKWIEEGIQDYNNLYNKWSGVSGSWDSGASACW